MDQIVNYKVQVDALSEEVESRNVLLIKARNSIQNMQV